MFDGLAISRHPQYTEFLNTHHVIYMDLTVGDTCQSVPEFIDELEYTVGSQLKSLVPELDLDAPVHVDWHIQQWCQITGKRCIFVIDNWDHILRTGGLSDREKGGYQAYFTGLLKGRSYVALAYMTGVLPVVPMTSGSGLNMFSHFTVTHDPFFSTIFGFTDSEVDELYTRYVQNAGQDARISRQDLQAWCGGYATDTGEQLYNPKSVVEALSRNTLTKSWHGSGPYNEVFDCVRQKLPVVREDIEKLLTCKPVHAVLDEAWATQSQLTGRDDILSTLLVYGLVTLDTSYGSNYVRIPNDEIRTQWVSALT